MSEVPSVYSRRQKALIGASIPRSGHHFLQSLLSRYFGDEMFYCEVYSRDNCCKSVPCTRTGSHLITYQKSHDRKGELRKDVEDALYIIQYREPVGEAVSDRELDMVDHLGRKSLNYRLSADYYAWWLALKAGYYRDFHDKWFAPQLESAIYLDYAALSSDPAGAIGLIAQRATGHADETRIAQAVAEAASTRAGKGPRKSEPGAYVPRQIEESAYFDRDLLACFEAYVLARCPNYGFAPKLNGSFREHPFHGLVLLHDEREQLPPGISDRLDAAAQLAPDHPEIVLRLARRQLGAENAEAAITALESLVDRHPYVGQAYKALFEAYGRAGRPIHAGRIGGDAVFACSDNPVALLELAEVYLKSDMRVNAIAALSFLAALEPDNFRGLMLLARALADERQWKQAEIHAERAFALRPKHKEVLRLLARIRKQLGKKHVRLVGETAAIH